jgi:two-component system, NarL family, invasion response regulator UvrY
MHILIADDHAVVRRGLREILADSLPGTTFSEAGNADEALGLLAQHATNLVVLDINMPGRSGLDVLKDVKHIFPRLPVIVLSVQPEDQYAVRCLRNGASAYINKDSAPEELAIAARKVLAGGHYVGASLAEKLASRFDESTARPRHEVLSDRELEVMLLIAAGVSLTEIANRLHVSAKTVSSYRARLMDKMQMTSNAEVTRYALTHGLVD